MTPLPTAIDAIDADWLTAALRQRFPGVAVRSVERGDPIWGTGTKIRVHVTYDAAGEKAGLPPTLIVKGGFAAHRELMYDTYESEVRFYRDVAEKVDIRVPRCYFADCNREQRQGIVILEDLDAAGARFCRVQQTLNYDQAVAHLDLLAALHARWWDDRAVFAAGGPFAYLAAHDPLPEGDAGAYQRGQLRPEVYAHYMGLPRGVAVSRKFHDRERMDRAMERLREFDRRGPLCFVHTDPHLGNLYFDAHGGAGLLDWQSIRKGPWFHDVGYFLVSSLDMLDRRAWEQPLLKHYLAALTRRGVKAPSFAEAWEHYRAQSVYGLYYWLVNPVEFQAEVNNCAVAPRFACAAIDHGAFEILLGDS